METGENRKAKRENRKSWLHLSLSRRMAERGGAFRFPNFDFRSRRRHTDSGQAAVEFALTTVFIMFFILWVIEIILFVYSYSVLADAAKEGVRYAVVHGCGVGAGNCSGTCSPTACSDTSGAKVITQVRNYAKYSFHDISGMTVTVNYVDGTSAAPGRVQVIIHYPFKSFFSLGWTPPTINAAAEGRIVF